MLSTRQTYTLLGSLVLFFGLISGSWFLWLFGGIFFLLDGLHRWWVRRLPAYLSLSWEADQTRVMPGTPVHIRLTLTNRSWMPLPLTRLQFSLPEHVRVEGADDVQVRQKQTVVQLWLSIPRRSQAVRLLTLIPEQRGVVWLSEVTGDMIDLFGDEACKVDLPLPFSLLVYPMPLPLPDFSLGDVEPVGSRLSLQRLQDDPTFLRGLRPYASGDRLKAIDWKASAKTGSLQTRQFEFTARSSWRVVGHILPSYEPLLQRYNDEVNERTISCLAAVGTRCRRSGLAYELLLNVRFRGKDCFQLPKGSGKTHHVQAMTQLVRLNQHIPTSLPALLRRLEHSREKEAILVVSPRIDAGIEEALQRLVVRGHAVLVLDVSGKTPVCRPVVPLAAQKGGLA
ncbi:DUF58 domain-containing protein [Brevibacillus sp. SYP-B805]|uniref:DUF58 domain-containing protein n=1 Tax=Brevibacillus sp. SYP-B805 TaxID=1578199 RepID=UPI0013EA2CAF|nr:DUF58 domain-containing protein [Brevibacillus sp. SYP-B805]NGQ95984.1 DUF58 domain-containing protein [Brevibacillus sp. SYP-B805]